MLGFELRTFGRAVGCSYPLSHLTSPTGVSFGELTSGTSPGAHLEWAREVKFGTDNSSGECHRPSRLLWEDQPSAGAQTSKAEPQCHFVFFVSRFVELFLFFVFGRTSLLTVDLRFPESINARVEGMTIILSSRIRVTVFGAEHCFIWEAYVFSGIICLQRSQRVFLPGDDTILFPSSGLPFALRHMALC